MLKPGAKHKLLEYVNGSGSISGDVSGPDPSSRCCLAHWVPDCLFLWGYLGKMDKVCLFGYLKHRPFMSLHRWCLTCRVPPTICFFTQDFSICNFLCLHVASESQHSLRRSSIFRNAKLRERTLRGLNAERVTPASVGTFSDCPAGRVGAFSNNICWTDLETVLQRWYFQGLDSRVSGRLYSREIGNFTNEREIGQMLVNGIGPECQWSAWSIGPEWSVLMLYYSL